MSCYGVDFEGDYFYFYAVKDLKSIKPMLILLLKAFKYFKWLFGISRDLTELYTQHF